MFNDEPYYYSAYGLNIRSYIKIPGFVEIARFEKTETDVEIFRKKITKSVIEKHFGKSQIFETPECDVRVSKQAMCFDYPKTGTILVSGGNKVVLDLRSNVQEYDVIPYLTGYVSAILLHQRNFLVLHASVTMINGIGVAFLGAKGYGKSTLAASLEGMGHRLISDDLLPIVFKSDEIFTLAGYPQIKLYEDSVNALGVKPSRLHSVHRKTSKYSLNCQNFSDEKIKLSAIYVLNIDDQLKIVNMNLAQAFIEATTHTHVNYYLQASNSLEWHFEHCQKLVQTLPFFQLGRPHDFEKIFDVAATLEKHVDKVVKAHEPFVKKD
jgi:hypothetical protein